MAGCKYCEDRKHWAFKCDVRTPDGEYGSKDITVPVRFCPNCSRELVPQKPRYENGLWVRVNMGLLIRIGWLPSNSRHQNWISNSNFKVQESRMEDGGYLYKLKDFPEGGWIPENCLYTV